MREFVQAETLLEADAEQIEHYFGLARAVARELGVDLRLPRTRPRPHPPGTPGVKRCDWPWRGSYISYDGHAMPCCMVATPDRINFGKVTDAAWRRPGTARPTSSFANSWTPTSRRRSAARARSTRARFREWQLLEYLIHVVRSA
jgi:hypothetical protein